MDATDEIRTWLVGLGGIVIPFALLMLMGCGAFWSTILTLAVGRYVFYFFAALIQA